jgi:beta-mannosidase
MQQVSLSGTWQLTWHDDAPQFLVAPEAPGRLQLEANVPAPVHYALMQAGLLEDPRFGLNALRARWVEEQFWVYRRQFLTPPNIKAKIPVWLDFALLEYDAVVYLNGERIGQHANAHRPARFDITGKLKTDGSANILIVQLDAGLFGAADKPGGEYRANPAVLLTKRHWHRKGQWQAGWDWQQRLMNVGILGDVTLTWGKAPRVVQTQVYAVPSDDLQKATVTARVFVENKIAEEMPATLRLSVGETDLSATREVVLPLGESEWQIDVEIENPRLWWPVGHGAAYRY